MHLNMSDPELRKTALNAIHRQLGARMVQFAGWDMPVQYAGPIQEHLAVRTRAGIFDVSHMGELEIKGPGAQDNPSKTHVQRHTVPCRFSMPVLRPDHTQRSLRG